MAAFHGIRAFQHLSAHIQHGQKNIQVGMENLGNHSIPGKSEKVVGAYHFDDYLKHSGSALKVTHAQHIPIQTSSGGGAKVTSHKNGEEVSVNGNSINPEAQLQKINEATLALSSDIKTYQTFIEMYKPFTSMGR